VTGTLTPAHTFKDNGSYTVTLTVTDAANATATDTALVTVSNVPPTATLGNNGPVAPTASVTISFTNQSDPSPVDTAAGFKYSYDFNNDGTWDVTDSTSPTAQTSFPAAGSYTVKGRIKDKDGGYTDYTTTVEVTSTTGLVAYFPFDEGSGTTVHSTVGGLTGTISNASWSTNGKYGDALSFNGTNSWVTVADSNALDLTTGMTLEAWVQPVVINGWECVILKEDTTDLAYALYADDNGDDIGGLRVPSVSIREGSTTYEAHGASQVSLNTWTHLAATYDGSVIRYYVNGTLTNSVNQAGAINTTTGVLRFGGDSLWGEYFNGLIDEVRIYNRALSASEIQADMNPAPTVTAVSPANGATAVATATPVTVTFSQAMDATTITTSSVQLQGPGGTAVSANVSYNASNYTATLTPSASLALQSTYTVIVHGGTGANAVKNSSGNPMGSDFNSTFTTTDGSPPTANAGSDQSGNEGSGISFSGSVSGGVAPFSYDWNWGDGSQDTTGTLAPTHAFPDNGTYTVTLTVTDSANHTGTDTATATVANVPPTASFGNNGPVAPNASVTIAFNNQYDPSSVDTAAGFKYSYDFNNDGTWDITDSTSASATTSFATPGTYTVKGRIKDKDGGYTDYTTTVQVNSGTAPAAPTDLSAAAVSQSEVNLVWDLSDATDTGVVVERKTGSGGTYQTLAVLPGGEDTYTDTSGWASKTYYYRVKARNAGGDSAYSAEVSATTDAVPSGALAVVSNLHLTANSPTTATIAFTDTNSGKSPLYLLERSSDGVSYRVVASLQSSTSDQDYGLTPGATYYYRVRAGSYSYSTSDYSAPVPITMPSPASGLPAVPAGIEAIDLSATSTKLTWTNTDPSNPQFAIERAVLDPYTGTQSWSQIAVTAAGATSFTDTGLTPETPYAYRVRAKNATGYSDYGSPGDDVQQSMFGNYVGVDTASAGTGSPKTYDIGPGQPYPSIGALDWSIVGPGDTVRIHYKPGGYHEIFQIAGRGTPAAWITVEGVPDPATGALPVIDGQNAVLATQFENHYPPLSGSGLIVIGARLGYTAGYRPGYIEVEGLQVQNSYSAYQFTNFDGTVESYGNVGAGIYIERADHVTLYNNVVTNNGEGIFGAGQSGFDRLMTNITLDSNYIYGNGNVGTDQQHNTYLEGIDTLYQFNQYGPLRDGSGGIGLKDRSVGTIIRYNNIVGGQHQIQLSESQNQMDLAITIPRYHQSYVYGNVLTDPPGDSSDPIWYGGDLGLDVFQRKGVLYLWNNTIVVQSTHAQVYGINAIEMTSSAETLDARNNIFAAVPSTSGSPTYFGLLSGYASAYFGVNWVSAGWQMTVDNSGFTGHAGGTADLITGSSQDPGFVNGAGGDFHLAAGSVAIDASGRVAGNEVPFSLDWEYEDPHTGKQRTVVGSAPDLGAFEYGI
jgi:parallel beta-helix repeat protein